MKANFKSFSGIIILVMVAGLLGVFFLGRDKLTDSDSGDAGAGKVAGTNSGDNVDYLNKLAKHLSDKGVVLYGSFKSEDSNAQRNIFGEAAKLLNYVECDSLGENANPDECAGQKIEVYPTWIYEGVKYLGVQSLGDLAKVSGFAN